MKENLIAIGYPLPEDIEKLKWYGDFESCLSLIDRRLREDIPETLKEKLRIEKVQIRRMQRNYTVSEEEAQKILRENLRDYREEELRELREANLVDWIFVKGEIRYIDSFYDNLIKIRKDIADRQLYPEVVPADKPTSLVLRDTLMAKMKEEGSATCRMTLRASVELGEELQKGIGEFHIHVSYPLEKLQIKNLRMISCNPAPKMLPPSKASHPTVYFEGNGEEVKRCEVVYSLDNTMQYFDLKPENVSTEQPGFYLGEQLPHISFTPYMRALTEEIVGDETNPLLKARRIYDFITTKVNYSFMRSYIALPNIVEYCASRLRGDCGVQALTFITMCRIAGVPARWQSGLYADNNGAGCHDWAMFYVAPYGWLWADPSFGGSAWRAGMEERWNFYFGNLDPYRVCLTDEFQMPFVPEMKYLRSDPYDNQMGEVERSDRPVSNSQWTGKAEVLSCEIL